MSAIRTISAPFIDAPDTYETGICGIWPGDPFIFHDPPKDHQGYDNFFSSYSGGFGFLFDGEFIIFIV